MSTIDLTPLYGTMVGFDRLAGMIDQAARLDGTQGYPPYNIERVGEDAAARPDPAQIVKDYLDFQGRIVDTFTNNTPGKDWVSIS